MTTKSLAYQFKFTLSKHYVIKSIQTPTWNNYQNLSHTFPSNGYYYVLVQPSPYGNTILMLRLCTRCLKVSGGMAALSSWRSVTRAGHEVGVGVWRVLNILTYVIWLWSWMLKYLTKQDIIISQVWKVILSYSLPT